MYMYMQRARSNEGAVSSEQQAPPLFIISSLVSIPSGVYPPFPALTCQHRPGLGLAQAALHHLDGDNVAQHVPM